MGRLSASMIAFRRSPEDVTAGIVPSGRQDEIGAAERELEIMQTRLRFALKQKAHLAALGVAVTKISHDLRNILSTTHIVSDSLSTVDDPKVQKIVPRLVSSIDQAIELCTQTLKFGKAEERSPKREFILLAPLIEDLRSTILISDMGDIVWQVDFPADFEINADREQIYRVLMNLLRNAMEAINGAGEVRISAEKLNDTSLIRITDNGAGIPVLAREHLFEPFTGSVKSGGTGLGLSIARELVAAHGGTIELDCTGPAGTSFVICIPD